MSNGFIMKNVFNCGALYCLGVNVHGTCVVTYLCNGEEEYG